MSCPEGKVTVPVIVEVTDESVAGPLESAVPRAQLTVGNKTQLAATLVAIARLPAALQVTVTAAGVTFVATAKLPPVPARAYC